jgi:hypothetical protein
MVRSGAGVSAVILQIVPVFARGVIMRMAILPLIRVSMR